MRMPIAIAKQIAAKTNISPPACSFIRRSRIRLAVWLIGSHWVAGGSNGFTQSLPHIHQRKAKQILTAPLARVLGLGIVCP